MPSVETALPAPPFQEETVIQIRLTELHPFSNHPFKVRDNEAMRGMLESVREYGVLTPAIVRSRESGGYETSLDTGANTPAKKPRHTK